MISIMKKICFVSLLLLIAGKQTRALTIQQVSHSPEQAQIGESFSVSFTLDEPAHIDLEVFDAQERRVAVVSSKKTLTAGQHQLIWNTQTEQGKAATEEAYHYRLLGKTTTDTVIYDMTDKTGGELLRVSNIHYDPNNQMLSYTLPKPARVNIRVGFKEGGPLLATLIDWVPRTKGKQAENWQGWDNSRQLNIANHPLLDIQIRAFALSQNTLFLGKTNQSQWNPVTTNPVIRPKLKEKRKKMRHYAKQDPLKRRDIEMVFNIINNTKKTKEGLPIINDKAEFRLDVTEADRERTLASRFEPMFFVDGEFIMEIELGYLPTTWQWDASRATPGRHYITANILGYEGHIGAATIAVWVEKKAQQSSKK